jgi:hypothetical protein
VSWSSLWLVVFLFALLGSALLSLLIAIRGWGEIRALFSMLDAPRRDEGTGERR